MRAVIYWYYKKRDVQKLNEIESLHFSYMKRFKFNDLFRHIDVTVSFDDDNLESRSFVREIINKNFSTDTSVTEIMNSSSYGEYPCYYKDVFKKLIDDNETVFYCHLKGVKKEDDKFILSRKKWIDVLYNGCFSERTISNTEKYPICGAHKETKDKLWFTKFLWRYRDRYYFNEYKQFMNLDGTSYLDGSFQWINPKLLKGYISSKGADISDIAKIQFENIRFTHFSEYFLCSLIGKDYIYADNTWSRELLGY